MGLDLETLEIFLRVTAALVFGAAVGLERQWRSRMAGIRTNALVSAGAALFVVLGTMGAGTGPGADPTRVAAQVVSGIGFLGAGVILRDGLNIRGLNTAATLWCSAAVGSLAGFGFYWVAGFGAVAVIASNTGLRPLSRAVVRRRAPDEELNSVDQILNHYLLEVRTADKNEQRIRALVLQFANGPGLSIRSIESSTKKNSQIAFRAEIVMSASGESIAIERALKKISLDPKVTSVRWWDARVTD